MVRITANPGETFLDRMIAMVEGARRQKTPNEIALNILLAGLTIIFLLATVTLLPVGSALLGQPFDDPKYFWGRLSATSPAPYTAFNAEKQTGSSGSNYGPLNPALLEAVQGRMQALQEADPGNTAPIPVDLVTASGSGLDPHISPAAAAYQVGRVARARGLSEQDVRRVVAQYTEDRTLGLLGEPRVNVLALNLALDQH